MRDLEDVDYENMEAGTNSQGSNLLSSCHGGLPSQAHGGTIEYSRSSIQ